MKDILVGIVTFNPDISRLKENFNSIYNQDVDIIVFDNHSNNIKKIKNMIKFDYPKLHLITNSKNHGLGFAYNYFFNIAIKKKYEWVMLLDQDSVCDSHLLAHYRKHLSDNKKVGMYTCIITDRNSSNNIKPFVGNYKDIFRCISSASLMRTKAYIEGCKYDEKFFIDKLDYDMCYLLHEHGYVIRMINYKGLLQEVGHSRDHKFLWHKFTVYNHSSFRRYYMARNGIWLSRKHSSRSFIKSVGKETIDIISVLFYEEDKINKLKAFYKGIKDGFKMEIK